MPRTAKLPNRRKSTGTFCPYCLFELTHDSIDNETFCRRCNYKKVQYGFEPLTELEMISRENENLFSEIQRRIQDIDRLKVRLNDNKKRYQDLKARTLTETIND